MAQAIRNAETPPPVHDTGLVDLAVRGSDGKTRRVQIRRDELVRRAMAAEIARVTVALADGVHITEAGRRISLDHQWMDIYADPACDMRIIAPAQRGKTLYQIVKTMAQLYLGLSVGWVMPKYGKIQELVNGKLNGTIKNTDLYRELQDASGGADTTQFKTFGEYGKLYLVTANSENELTAFSADCMHIDERDLCNRTNLPMYPSRMNASPYRLTDEISTPTYEGGEVVPGQAGSDNIHSEWMSGDRYRYYSICPHCGLEQILDWYQNVIDVKMDESGRVMTFDLRDKDWSPGSARDISVCCRRCRRPFNRLAPGRWVAERPGRRMRSRWVEGLATAMGPSLESMLTTYSRSIANPSKAQHFHNMDLGRPYAGGMLRFTEELFNRCADQGHTMALESDGPCTIGIDVNVPWLDIHISRWIGGKQVKLWVGKLNANEEQLVNLCLKFGVVGGVIDTQPEHRVAMGLQDALASHKIRLVRCKYATTDMAKMIVVSEAGDNPKLDPPRLITVNKTVAVDTLYESMQMKTVVWFRDWKRALDGALLQEFITPVRKLATSDTGAERYIWEGKPDHQLHAAVYDLLGGEVLGMNTVRDYSEVMPMINEISHGGGGFNQGSSNVPGNIAKDDQIMILRG